MGKVIDVPGRKNCRLGNWLFWIFSEKDYNINEDTIVITNKCNNDVKYNLKRLGVKIETKKDMIETTDYKQDFSLFDLEKLRKQIVMPDDVRKTLYDNIPDIEERVMINVRRGDFLSDLHKPTFYSMSKSYIEKVYNKYYKGMKVLIVSDDKDWCVDNLSDIADDVVIYHFDDILCDFFANTLTKANILGCSSFSMMGAYLNKNEDCVIHYPYFKRLYDGEKIIPTYAKRENVTDDMK